MLIRLLAALLLLPTLAFAHGEHVCPRSAFSSDVIQLDVSDAITQEYIDGDITLQFGFDWNLEIAYHEDYEPKFMGGKIEYESSYVKPASTPVIEDNVFWNSGTCALSGPNWNILTTGIYCTSLTDVDEKLTFTITSINPSCAGSFEHVYENMEGATDSTRQWGRAAQVIFELQPDLEEWPGPVLDDFCTILLTPCAGVSPSFTLNVPNGPHGNQTNLLFPWGHDGECDSATPTEGGYILPLEVHVNWNSNTTGYDGGDCYYSGYTPDKIKCVEGAGCQCCAYTETQKASRRTTFGEVKAIYREE